MFWNDEESLNGCTAPSEVTRNALMRPRSVTKASVMPSANQEWSVSRDRSASGRTASERIRAIRAPGRARPSQSPGRAGAAGRSEEHTSELQSRLHLVCRLLLEKKKTIKPLLL